MTNSKFKKRVRELSAKTGQPYAKALQQLQGVTGRGGGGRSVAAESKSKPNVSAQDYSKLLADTQLLLIAVVALEPTSGPYGTELRRCKQIAELPEAARAAVFEELAAHGLGDVRLVETVGVLVTLTDLGRAAVKQLTVIDAGGPVEELSTNLSKVQRAILDAVVSSHLRNRNPPSKSHVRALTRQALDPKPSIDAVNLEIDALLRDHLVAGASADPPLWLKLPGILESSWGRNALHLFEHVLGAIADEDPGAPQFSFGMLLKRGVSPRLFGLGAVPSLFNGYRVSLGARLGSKLREGARGSFAPFSRIA